jgi:hypothetical protein
MRKIHGATEEIKKEAVREKEAPWSSFNSKG